MIRLMIFLKIYDQSHRQPQKHRFWANVVRALQNQLVIAYTKQAKTIEGTA